MWNDIKRSFVEIEGEKVELVGHEEFDFFIHKELSGGPDFVISEGRSGLKIRGGESREKAITETVGFLSQFLKEQIERVILEKIGGKDCLSPRYLMTDEVKESDLSREAKELEESCRSIVDNLPNWVEKKDWLLVREEIRKMIGFGTRFLFSIPRERKVRNGTGTDQSEV